MIDERLGLVTPEGAELNLTLAGPVPRTAAFLIDLLIRAAVYLILSIVLSFLGGAGRGLMLIGVFLIEWFYPVIFEVFWQGQTPGKRALGIAVSHDDGTPVTVNGSLLRNLLRTADFFPMAYFAGYLTMLSNRRFQRLGDLAAGTLVVHIERPDLKPVRVNIAARHPDWSVSLDQQRTLVAFLERGINLSQARRQELAALAYPELDPENAETRALANARYLLGDDGE